MKIALDITATCVEKKSGIAYYASNLMDGLYKVLQDSEIELFCRLSRYKKSDLCYNPKAKKLRFYQHPIWPVFKKADLIHGFDASIPPWRKVQKVCTIHDLLILKDLDRKICSERFKEKKGGEIQNAIRNTDAIIAISQTTKEDILDQFDFPEEKIFVTHLGVSELFRPIQRKQLDEKLNKYNLPENFILYLGGISERKNVTRMIQAYANSKVRNHMPLILAGEMSWGHKASVELIEQLKLQNDVIFLGYVPEEDLPFLYNRAQAFLFATLYEGFGLPILESMACQTPVIVGDQGAGKEIAGGHAIVVDPYDVSSIAEGIEAGVDLSSDAIEKGRKHASNFTWQRCAESTVQVYQHLLN